MTPQEQQMIDGLISRIRNTRLEDKDVAAEQHIQQALAGYPDALYVLVQTVLVQQYGLEQAQGQLDALKQQNADLQKQVADAAQSKGSGGSFLSHIFGSGGSQSTQPAPPQNPQYQPVNAGYGNQGYPPPPPPSYPAQSYPPAGGGGMFGGGMFGGSGGGGFLRGALQTAAGVAAGEMVFQGMEDLFHGFGHGGGYERGLSGGGGETIVNNYYDDDNRNRDSGTDSGFYNPDNDASREASADTDRGFLGDSGDTGNGQDFADTSADSDSFSDSGGFDGGGDDFSGGDDNSF